MKSTLCLVAASLLILTAVQGVSHASTAETEQLQIYLSEIIPRTDSNLSPGEQAIIVITRQGSTIIEASVSASGDTGFARELHRRIDWKNVPVSDRETERFIVTLGRDKSLSVTRN